MELRARDIMTTQMITLSTGMACQKAIQILRDNNISGAPVMNELGDMVGIVSIKDLLAEQEFLLPLPNFYDTTSVHGLALEDSGLAISPKTIEKVMIRHIYTVPPEATLAEVSKTLYRQRIHRLVVTENNEPIGIISTFDLLKTIAETPNSVAA